MSASRQASRNLLLDAIPDEAWARLSLDLVPVEMPAGQILHRPSTAIRDAYFPTTSIVSSLYLMEDGSSSGVALVGPEGMVGVSLFLGRAAPPDQAQVLRAGQGWKVPAQRLAQEFGRGGALTEVLLGYTQSLIVQMMQTSACNSRGTLQERLCRWLLMNLDRAPGDEMKMTHQTIADVLGVRRESVSETAGVLQDQGAIRYRWGRISVLDRPALERRVCACYRCPDGPVPRAPTSSQRHIDKPTFRGTALASAAI